jgi:hypothetical protein
MRFEKSKEKKTRETLIISSLTFFIITEAPILLGGFFSRGTTTKGAAK